MYNVLQTWMARAQPVAGMAHSQPHTAILVTNMRRNRTQPIVPRVTASDFYTQLGRRKLNLVVEYRNAGKLELEVTHGFLHGTARLVHVSLRLQQHDAFVTEPDFGDHALKSTAPWWLTMTPRNFIHGHEADIVPIVLVFRVGVAETNEESSFHDAASRASARSVKVGTGFASDRAPTYWLAHDLSPNRSHFGGSCALLLLVAATGRRFLVAATGRRFRTRRRSRRSSTR